MEAVGVPSNVEQSLLVSTMVYYGRKLKRERKNRLTRKLSEFGVKVSAGLSVPYVLGIALPVQAFKKGKNLLITGGYVPPLLGLAEDSTAEERAAYEAFQSKVLKSPLFWLTASLSVFLEFYALFATAGLSLKSQAAVSLALSAPGSAATRAAGLEAMRASASLIAGIAPNIFGSARAVAHIARHDSEVKKVKRKSKDLRYQTA